MHLPQNIWIKDTFRVSNISFQFHCEVPITPILLLYSDVSQMFSKLYIHHHLKADGHSWVHIGHRPLDHNVLLHVEPPQGAGPGSVPQNTANQPQEHRLQVKGRNDHHPHFQHGRYEDKEEKIDLCICHGW